MNGGATGANGAASDQVAANGAAPTETTPSSPPAPTLAPAPRPPLWRRRPSRRLWIRIAIAAVLIVAAALTNRSFLGWGLFVVFAIMIVPISRARSFLHAFVPYAAVWFVFTALRSLADETILAKTLNTQVSQLERWLFDGQLPSAMLQHRLFDPYHLHWYDYFCTGIHWSFFIVPHIVAIRLWQKDPAFFRRYLRAMTLLLAVGLLIYFLIPSNPPWMAPEAVATPAAPTVYRVMISVVNQLGGGIYKATYNVIGESNPIAAMPSIHFAITFLLFFGAGLGGRKWRIVALIYSAAMAFSLVYLGEHYVVDICVGALVTTYAWVASGTWLASASPNAIGRSLVRVPRPVATQGVSP